MSAFDWHPRYHRDALDGMLMLTLEERGAFNTILDLFYDRGAAIPDDPRWLAGWMGVSVRKWQSLRAALIVKGKIEILTTPEGDVISNSRAVFEIENQTKRQRNFSESGAKGGRKRAENEAASNENNDLGQATLEASLKLKTKTETYTLEDKSSKAEVVDLDPDRQAWSDGVSLLCRAHRLTEDRGRAFFGKLLAQNQLKARELLPAIGQCLANGTEDPRAYLTKAAQSIARRRDAPSEPVKPKRVAWV